MFSELNCAISFASAIILVLLFLVVHQLLQILHPLRRLCLRLRLRLRLRLGLGLRLRLGLRLALRLRHRFRLLILRLHLLRRLLILFRVFLAFDLN